MMLKHFLIIVFVCISSIMNGQATMKSRLDSLYQSYFNPGEPGAAVLIVKDGNVIYENGFGVADIKTREPITANTLFNIGSISKTFVAFGILELEREGKLQLDDPISKYFPGFKNKKIAKRVKLYHLMTHSSGIPDSRRVEEQKEFYLTARDAENWAPLENTDTLLFPPGSAYRYSNPAFNGLALIIEQLTQHKWQTFIDEKIFRPSGMLRSTITDGPHPESGVSHAYFLNAKKEFEELDYGEEPTFAAAGNGGVWSSVRELWQYEQAIQQHKFLDENYIEKSRTVFKLRNWKQKAGSLLGLSWFITKDAGRDMIGHTGSQGGFISDYCWWPKSGLFYVLLCNTPKPIKEIRAKMLSIVEGGITGGN
jgi:CubicO group peptidase (beta-lactamase class C family)